VANGESVEAKFSKSASGNVLPAAKFVRLQ
jgi:hypothetical protein